MRVEHVVRRPQARSEALRGDGKHCLIGQIYLRGSSVHESVVVFDILDDDT